MSEYIDKKALLDEICRDNCERSYDGTCHNCRMTETIADFPAADVQPVVHGHWYFAEDAVFRCSVCERICLEDNAPYCYCGARMDGKEPDNEVSEP